VRQRDLGVGGPVVVVGEQVQPVENWALVEAVQHALDQAVEERALRGALRDLRTLGVRGNLNVAESHHSAMNSV
jgi:hypothetical protein